MKLSDRDPSAWHKFGFALTAITVVLAGGLVIESSELAMDGWEIIGWQFICVIPLVGGMVAYLARRVWLAGRLTRHSIEPEARILLPPLAVIAIGARARIRCDDALRVALLELISGRGHTLVRGHP